MIKAIIFDCFGVLTTDLWKEFLSSLPKEIDIEALRTLNYQFDKGQITADDFMAKVRAVSGQEIPMLEFLSDDQLTAKNTRLMGYIGQLKTNFKIGLLSNISSNWIREHFLDYEEQQIFDDIVMSFEVGIAKPASEIFILAAERLKVKPNECLFIDDAERNCLGATQTGMVSIVYISTDQCIDDIKALLSTQKGNN